MTANVAQQTAMAEAIKNMLAKVGITWKVEMLDPAAISEKIAKGGLRFRRRRLVLDLRSGSYGHRALPPGWGF